MSHVFISHATPDDKIVTRIHDALEAAKLGAWVDHKDAIESGDNWSQQIQDALNTCGCGLFVLTPDSARNPNCEAEYWRILGLNRRLYIALAGKVQPEDFPWRLGIIQYTDLTRDFDAGMTELIAAIQGGRPVSNTASTTLRPFTGLTDRKLLEIPMTGREDDRKGVIELLRENPVSILGVGGVGKSRLAVAVAASSPDVQGAIWHKADDLSNADDVIGLIRDHFDLDPATNRRDVLAHLRTHKRLIVIDNAESVDETRRPAYAKLIDELYTAGAQILLTGRAEWTEIELGRIHRPAALDRADGAQIVLDMGRVFGSPYDLSPLAGDLAEAALLHPRLIEWAVKQTKGILSPQAVLDDLRALKSRELERALDEMIHKTLRQMNNPTAEKLLKRLAVCRGSFSSEAAQTIAGMPTDDFRDALRTLGTWQFITTLPQTDNSARYAVDPLALECITPDEDAHRPHFEFYQRLHGDQEANLNEDRHPAMQRDFPNLRAALDWGLQHEPERAVDLVSALNYYLQMREPLEVRHNLLKTAYTTAAQKGYVPGQANTLKALGDLMVRLAELSQARGYYDQALPLYDQIGDRLGQANTLQALGDLMVRLAELSQARGYYDQALPLYDQIGDRLGQANTLKALGDLMVRLAELSQARGYYDQALPLYDQIGDRLGQANTYTSIGDLLHQEQSFEAAVAAYDRSITIAEAIGDDFTCSRTQIYMIPTLIAVGNHTRALENNLLALYYFADKELESAVNVAIGSLRSLKTQIGAEAFAALWESVVGKPQPDWLQDA